MIGLSIPAAAVAAPEQLPLGSAPAPWEELPPEPQSLYVANFPSAPLQRDAFGVETVSPLEIAIASRTGSLEVWPSTAPVNDGYGWRDGGEFHNGIDIMADYGSPIVAASAGVVTTVTEDSGWGQYVKIDHGNGVSTLYAHMISGSPTVVEGQTVSAGEPIGSVGDTGYVTFFHLHFEVYVDGSRVDPYIWLP